MKLSTRIITALLLVAGSSGVVYAFSKHGDWGMKPTEKSEFVSDRVTKELDLDGEQQQKFDHLANLAIEIMQQARASREHQVSEISQLLEDPSFNQARALELIQQKTQLVNEKAPLVISSLAVFLDSLNSDQKQELQEFMQRHHSRGHGHGHGYGNDN
jgi:Spy/CpxP family protein refolding chaperone